MRTLLRFVLRVFPEDDSGVFRSEMERTFLDGYRASTNRVAYSTRGLFSLLFNGLGERFERIAGRDRRQAGGAPAPGAGPDPTSAETRGFLAMVRDDLHLAFRNLTKGLGFSIASVLTLAVGIGATVAMFSILNAALLRALPYPEPEELVLGRATFNGEMNMTCSYPDYLDHRDGSDAFEELAATFFSPQQFILTGSDNPRRAGTYWVTANFFDALDVAPALGRTFLPEDGEPDAPFVTVLSHAFWQSWFGGDPEALGQVLEISGFQVEVIGVMPAGFRFLHDTDMWTPVRLGLLDTEGRRSHSWGAVGRLRDGVTLAQAQAQMDVISAQLAEAYPESHSDKGFGLVPLDEGLAEDYRSGIFLLMGATSLLLLIACGNVAGLMAARATGRRVEISVKAAMGADRSALVRQLLMESLTISVIAGTFGSVLALWIQRATLMAVPIETLGLRSEGLSAPMLGFALAVSFATALIFGVGPALSASRAEPADALRGARSATSGKGSGRVRGGLVVAQVALSVVLLTGSGLLIRSFVELRSVDLGFDTENIVTARLYLDPSEYGPDGGRTEMFRRITEDVRALPGLSGVGVVDKVPIRDRWTNWYIWRMGEPPEDDSNGLSTYSRTVTPGYFQALGVPVLQGRDHAWDDGDREVPFMVISEATASRLFPEEDPIGRMVTVFNGMGESDYEVLGVVADFRITSVDREPRPQMYFSHAHRPSTAMNLVVRSRTAPRQLVPAIRDIVRGHDPDIPLEDVSAMTEVVSGSISANRLLGIATSMFAGTALLLSLTGLYAVLAFYVGQRTKEIGIRVACGATAGLVSGLVVRKGLGLVFIGLVLGLGGAAASTRLLRAQLFEVGAFDPLTFGLVAVGFVAVGVLAALLPAHRASRIDPVRAIQAE